MGELTAFEIAFLRESAEQTFEDTCTIHSRGVIGKNAYGEEVLQDTDTDDVPCGYSYTQKLEMENERGQVVTLDCDAVLRLSILETIGPKDEITVRGKRYKVDGVVTGLSVKLVALKSFEGDLEEGS